ncbi:DUF4384 domain-containing protein [Myxococcaceae bacterium GXIMD 01537]
MTTPSPHLSQLDLDAHLLRALPPEAAARAEAHLEACPRCREALAALGAAHQRFQAEVLPRTLPRLRERAAPSPARRPWLAWLVAPALALAGVALVLLRPGPGEEENPAYGYKGGPVLRVAVKHGDTVGTVADGARLSPGDALRFIVEPAGHAYVLVASVDGAGAVSVYHPYGGTHSARLPETSGTVTLPGSIVLDAAPGPERLWAFFSREPLARADVEAALRPLAAAGPAGLRRATAPLPVAASTQSTLLLEKETP